MIGAPIPHPPSPPPHARASGGREIEREALVADCSRSRSTTAEGSRARRRRGAVSDRFRVERLAAEALEAVRREEQRRLGSQARKWLKGVRCALLKYPPGSEPGEQSCLAALRRGRIGLLDEWVKCALRSRLARRFVKLARTVRDHAGP